MLESAEGEGSSVLTHPVSPRHRQQPVSKRDSKSDLDNLNGIPFLLLFGLNVLAHYGMCVFYRLKIVGWVHRLLVVGKLEMQMWTRNAAGCAD